MARVVYDRRVSPEFLSLFVANEDAAMLSSLVTYANEALFPVDLRFRKDQRSAREHATLYVGLTAVLNVRRNARGLLSLDAHATHKKRGGFDANWSTPAPVDRLVRFWPDVELYLDRVIPLATQSHGMKEGAVQAALASHRSSSIIVLDREVTPSFASTEDKQRFMATCEKPILEALASAGLGFSGQPQKLGNECDALAVDKNGRILAIEVKPLSGGTIAWVAAQATMYARILQAWVDDTHDASTDPVAVLRGMLEQRLHVGLSERSFDVVPPLRVVPVVALQRGASPEMIRRMVAVRDALANVDMSVGRVEIHEVNLFGALVPLDESRHLDGQPRPVTRAARTSYASSFNRRLEHWKATTSLLPDEARLAGTVRTRQGNDLAANYVLPREYAAYNLLPEVRDDALLMFKDLGITWHQGVRGGPSAHLRSSQVQCVNALGQMLSDPDRIQKAFGSRLDIARVRDFGEIDVQEAGRFLTFEFIGAKDYFGEGRGGTRTRGSQSTSVDAAFAYTTSQGVDELALLEWKFTEHYPSAGSGAEARKAERLRRYSGALEAEDSPIDITGIELSDLFHEPIYQLVRQQLLARALEKDSAVNASVVRVIHVLSPENTAYNRSFIPSGLQALGPSPDSVWSRLLRTPDRFIKIDPAIFLDPAVTSDAYCERYAGPRQTDQ